MKTSILAVLAALLAISIPARALDLGDIERRLNTTGIQGEVHGAVSSQGIFVFTYRDPNDFFDFIEMSLVAETPDLQRQLESLGRHDLIRVKGTFMPNPSPQKHIDIDTIEMIRKYSSPYPSRPYEYEAKIPDELLNASSAVFLVHAVREGGHVLVVEYKDAVLPIFVRDADLAKNLFRNDVVQLGFSIQQYPGRPTHLKLNESDPNAVRILDSIRAKHGKAGSVEGALVFFPKSPEINTNVFAVEEKLQAGLRRQYTLVNFDSPEAFTQILAKLQAAWDRHPGEYINGRNKLISTRLRVKANGTFNEVDPNQANPQILLASPDSVQIMEH